MMYVLNKGAFEFTKAEMVEFLETTITENNLILRNVLPTATLHRNCEHHPVRIAREMGFEVEVIH